MSKIKDIQLFKVPPRWLFLKITTDDGLSGWGEPIVEGKADTVAAAVKEFSNELKGTDPGLIEDIYQVLYRGSFYRGGPILMSAISGIEQALWDIKGKKLGVPVYELLGGAVRNKMKVYSWVGGDEPRKVAEAIDLRRKSGFASVKMNAVPATEWIRSPAEIDGIIKMFSGIREAVGWETGIALDFHGRVRKALAKTLFRELEFFKPMFIEEPLLPEHFDELRAIAGNTGIPVATGERLYGRSDFKGLLQNGYADIIQPDLSHAGGIWEVRKIAAMAEAYDVAVAPHCPLGPISLAASLQLDFCTPNAILQETSLGIHYHEGSNELTDYLKNPEVFNIKDGYMERPTLPGLGIEIDEEKVINETEKGHDWHNPVWRNPDGSVTEW